jgi:beta-N-acetylhexosaminidase
MVERLKRLVTLVLVAILILPGLHRASHAQEEDDEVMRLMERMSNAAKVGQLFLVTFPGSEVTDGAAIAELIRDYHIGGVVLRPEDDNIVNEGDTPAQVAALIGQLQGIAWTATQLVTETFAVTSTLAVTETLPVTETLVVSESLPGPFIPLFIAANQEGNGAPFTGIVSGTTPLPSEMALGATWNLSHTETVGRIVGQELSALGINMLLGPSLDVLENPRPESAGDLNVRSFGGEPFWVGKMGKAYIRGVHEGAEGQIAVVAKHFPGLGSSDRSLSEEISTVQRTLDKLKQVDLAPFFATAQADNPLARPDALMVSHIRFRGLEGGLYVTTRPISVDSQVLQRLLELPELASWREQGGVTVSDGLGVRALQRFYDPSEQSFNSRRIAQEAFLAGNDLLFLSQFAPGDWEDQIANIKSTITFFREKYESDPSFQALVDAAVARILRLKLALYGGMFSLSASQPDVETISEQVGGNVEAISAMGRDAITLLSPPSSDLVPSPPTLEDRIVIFTDGRTGKPCAACSPVSYIEPFKLQDTIVRLYGPDATGQVDPALVNSFTFDQLEEYLSAPPLSPTPTPTAGEEITPTLRNPIEIALEGADWIIFAMLDPADDPPQSRVVQRFLAEQADALRGPHVVVLAYGAPYYLDATEINKLSAYYVAYSRIEPFIETSVRALFGEFAPGGKPPVSVSGINYDLLTQTSPNPTQDIPLYYYVEPSEEEQPTPEPTEEQQPTPEPTEEEQPTPEPPSLEVGDKLRLYTGVIVDHNGHPVPDGTPVQFIFNYPQEGLGEHTKTETTRGGMAETRITLERTGQLDIFIQADPLARRIAMQVTIQEGGAATIVTPTPQPTSTPVPPTPTPTTIPEPEVEETSTPVPTVESEEEVQPPPVKEVQVGASDLALALLGVLIVGGLGYYAMRLNHKPVSLALRLGLWCVIGGLVLYLAYVLLLPDVGWLQEQGGLWVAGGAALVGGAVPLLVAWVIDQWSGSSR